VTKWAEIKEEKENSMYVWPSKIGNVSRKK
jgi:hypothetical protein